jgi:hypothetical protein
MRELHLVIRDVGHAPPSYYRAVEGANEISKNGLDLARRVICVLQGVNVYKVISMIEQVYRQYFTVSTMTSDDIRMMRGGVLRSAS